MNRILILFLSVFFCYTGMTAQQFKFGSVTKEELQMKNYSADTTALAVYLYDYSHTRYDFITDDFRLNSEYACRIKIFNEKETKIGNVVVVYDTQSHCDEKVYDIDAFTYNLEGDKIVKTKMDRKFIFKEKGVGSLYACKFSLPEVKAGSVIEFRYKVSSKNYYLIPDIHFQRSAPVANSCHEVCIPEYFNFKYDQIGSENITLKKSTGSSSWNLGQHTERYTVDEYKFTGENIRALKDEPFVIHRNDFVSKVKFELNLIHVPVLNLRKEFTTSWETIEMRMKEIAPFNSNITARNPFKKETDSILNLKQDQLIQINALMKLVQNKIESNGKYYLYTSTIRETVKEKKGNASDLNYILMAVLRDAGYNTYPVVLRRRNTGRISLIHPTIDDLNAVIIMVDRGPEEKPVFLNAGWEYGNINLIMSNFEVDKARVLGYGVGGSWVDLSKLVRNVSTIQTQVTLDKDKGWICEHEGRYNNNLYAQKKKEWSDLKMNEKKSKYYKDKFWNCTFDSIYFDADKESNMSLAKEYLKYTQPITSKKQLFLNLFPYKFFRTEMFYSQERMFPIEFDFTSTQQQTTMLQCPEGYELESLPESEVITTPDKKLKCMFLVNKNESQIVITLKYECLERLFLPQDYPAIREFFLRLMKKNDEILVFKKI